MNKIQTIIKELDVLETQFDSKNEWTADELSEWHTKCIVLFESLGLRESILTDFSVFFNSHLLIDGGKSSLFFFVNGSVFEKKPGTIHIMTIKSVFKHARKKVELIEEEERLIPAFVMNYFRSKDAYGHIYTALTSIEQSERDKNIESLVSSANSLLDSILDYDKDLQGKKLGEKLTLLENNNKISKRIAMDKELLLALNNSRIIRNIELIHPKKHVKQTVPFIIAISYAYLVTLQLKIMMNVGFFSLE